LRDLLERPRTAEELVRAVSGHFGQPLNDLVRYLLTRATVLAYMSSLCDSGEVLFSSTSEGLIFGGNNSLGNIGSREQGRASNGEGP